MPSRPKFKVMVKHALLAAIWVSVPIVEARAESPADAWITAQARSVLRVEESERWSAVDLDTRDGRVTLYGKVQRVTDRAEAAEDVRDVPGVIGVRNLLQVVSLASRERTRRSDDSVEADVQRVLSGDRLLADSHITVKSVSNGVVFLSGNAASMNDNIRALRATADRPGVRRVFSEIEAISQVTTDLAARAQGADTR